MAGNNINTNNTVYSEFLTKCSHKSAVTTKFEKNLVNEIIFETVVCKMRISRSVCMESPTMLKKCY